MPPSEPPTTRSRRSIPSASTRRHWARAWSRVETPGNPAPYGRPVAGSSDIGPVVPYRPPSRFAASTPTRSVSSARPGPISGSHQSPAASAEPVSAWITRTCGAVVGARTVVPVRDGQCRQGRAVVELERPEGDRLEAAGPQRRTGHLDRAGRCHCGRPRRPSPTVSRPRRRARRRPGSRPSRPPAPARDRRSGRRRARDRPTAGRGPRSSRSRPALPG